MARAIVRDYGRIDVINGVPKMQVEITYGGSGVPAPGYLNESILVDISGATDDITLASTVASAVRTQATNRGFTVAALQCFLPKYEPN